MKSFGIHMNDWVLKDLEQKKEARIEQILYIMNSCKWQRIA